MYVGFNQPTEYDCNGGNSCCTPENQCGVGQGDCDSNTDCNPSLVCGKDNCVGSGFDATDDCCMSPGMQKNHLG